MPKVTVCTGFSPAGYKLYGQRFLERFARHWAPEIDLVVYTEEPTPLPCGENRLIWEIPGCGEFIARHKDDPERNGRKPRLGWFSKDHETGYSYRFDAVKFCRQGFIPWHAAWHAPTSDYLLWLDADVVTLARVDVDWLVSLLPADRDVAYLGRDGKHTEIGFVLYRLSHALPLIEAFSAAYVKDELFALAEWHSAWVWDDCLARCVAEHGIRPHNLTPGGRGHVWLTSPLAERLDHLKGERRKRRGTSR